MRSRLRSTLSVLLLTSLGLGASGCPWWRHDREEGREHHEDHPDDHRGDHHGENEGEHHGENDGEHHDERR